MTKTIQGWLILACALSMAALVGCVGELGGSSGADKVGFCQESGETGEGATCETDDDCSSGLRCYRDNNTRFCVVPCGDNDDCGPGACNLPEDDGNNADNNSTPGNNSSNNGDNNNTPVNNADNNGNNNADNNNNPVNNADNNNNPVNNNSGNSCQPACDLLFQCVNQDCPGALDLTPQQCVDQCNIDPVQFQADVIVSLTCADISPQLCPPPANETNAGAACTQDADCEAGTLQPFCIAEIDPDGNETGFAGGYCVAIGCQGDAACGVGNLCLAIDDAGNTACFDGCNDDACREGYACQDLTGGQQPGFNACVPACETDEDCGQGATCNADGTCG